MEEIVSNPNYVWYSDNVIITRYRSQIKNEDSEMRKKGFLKIYDCGNKVWIYQK